MDEAQRELGALRARSIGSSIARCVARHRDPITSAVRISLRRGVDTAARSDVYSSPCLAPRGLGAVERIRYVPSNTRSDTRVNSDDLGAAMTRWGGCFAFSKVLGDISMDPVRGEHAMPATLLPWSGLVRSRPRGARQPRSVLWFH
jgi:hypothetical protein